MGYHVLDLIAIIVQTFLLQLHDVCAFSSLNGILSPDTVLTVLWEKVVGRAEACYIRVTSTAAMMMMMKCQCRGKSNVGVCTFKSIHERLLLSSHLNAVSSVLCLCCLCGQ